MKCMVQAAVPLLVGTEGKSCNARKLVGKKLLSENKSIPSFLIMNSVTVLASPFYTFSEGCVCLKLA